MSYNGEELTFRRCQSWNRVEEVTPSARACARTQRSSMEVISGSSGLMPEAWRHLQTALVGNGSQR